MAKPATKPTVTKAKKAEVEPNADGHIEVNTDHVRPGAIGDYAAQSEEDAIKAAAKDHEPGDNPNVGSVDRPGLHDREDA